MNRLLTLQDARVRDLDKFEYSKDSKWLMNDMMDMAFRIGLVDRNDEHSVRYFRGVIDLSVHTYSYTKDRKILRAATLWSTWLFYIDDQYDEDYEFGTNIKRVHDLMEDCLELVKTGRAKHDTPFWRLGLEFYKSIMNELDEEMHWRMVAIVAKYFFRGAIEQMKFWRDGIVPSFEQFETRRLYDSATLPCEILVEMCGECVLPTSLFYDPRVEKLKSLWGRQISLLNDIYSYEKEVLKVGTDWNLLKIFMHHSKETMTLEGAVDCAIRHVNDLSDEFERVGEELIDDPTIQQHSDLLKKYVYAMRQWMVGHIVHSNDTYRYSDPLSTEEKVYHLPCYLID